MELQSIGQRCAPDRFAAGRVQHSEWSSPLVRELGLALLAKSIALFLIWLAFFSEPIDKSLTDAAVKKAVFGHPTPSAKEPRHGR